MYNIRTNNFHSKPKNSNIYTPPQVSQFIFDLLKDKFAKDQIILDAGNGLGSLGKPWKQAGFNYVFGIDNDPNSQAFIKLDFLRLRKGEIFTEEPQLVLCNPPFNGYGKQLGSERSLTNFNKLVEVWLAKIIELFGKDIPLVLFVPAGFRLNLTLASSRHNKFDSGEYQPISSLITLPKNIFPGVKFHCEILLFNISGLQGHYFYRESK